MEKSEFINSVILGSLLGDGHIESNGNKDNPSRCIMFTQNSLNETGYIESKFNLVNHLYKCNPIREGHNNTLRFSITAREKELTESMTKLTRYDNYKRKLPPIENINPVVLLYWYLDDGSLTIGKQKRPNGKYTVYRKLRIALQSYNDNDIEDFLLSFNDKFNLNFKPSRETIKGQKKIVSIGTSNNIGEITKFLDIINPYKDIIPKEMHYKFCLCYHETKNLKNHRLIEYNGCEFHNNGICSCRNKDYSDIYQ